MAPRFGALRKLRAARLMLAVAVAAALAAGCTVREPGRPAPAAAADQPAGFQIPYDDDTATFAEEFARVRTLDMCAMHDLAAAQRITGATPASLRMRKLDTCELELSSNDPSSSWAYEIDFGPPQAIGDPTGLELAGMTVEKRFNPDNSMCDFFVPVVASMGLRIHATYAQAAGTGPRPDTTEICRTAERYLTEGLLPRWSDPPTLAEGLTTPRSPIQGKDPCAALAAGVADVPDSRGTGKSLTLDNPYACDGTPGSSVAAYTVEFDVFDDSDLQGEPVQVGDFTLFTSLAVGAGACSLVLPLLPDFLFSTEEGTVYHAGVVIGLPDCAETAVAEKVLDNLISQPDVPPAGPNAQLIGDLDGA